MLSVTPNWCIIWNDLLILYGDDAVLFFALFVSRRDITDPLFAVRYQTEIYNAYKRVEATKNCFKRLHNNVEGFFFKFLHERKSSENIKIPTSLFEGLEKCCILYLDLSVIKWLGNVGKYVMKSLAFILLLLSCIVEVKDPNRTTEMSHVTHIWK
jgi:hypothetical protein